MARYVFSISARSSAHDASSNAWETATSGGNASPVSGLIHSLRSAPVPPSNRSQSRNNSAPYASLASHLRRGRFKLLESRRLVAGGLVNDQAECAVVLTLFDVPPAVLFGALILGEGPPVDLRVVGGLQGRGVELHARFS